MLVGGLTIEHTVYLLSSLFHIDFDRDTKICQTNK